MTSEVHRRAFLQLLALAGAGTAVLPGTAEAGTGFPLVTRGKAATIVVSAGDRPGVRRVVGDLAADVERVTGVRPAVSIDVVPAHGPVVLVGTLGHSPLVDDLVRAGRLDVTGVAGKWETSLSQVVDGTLVLTGSDQRGVIYGVYEISRRIGVSPWYWWADVPPRRSAELHLPGERFSLGTPASSTAGSSSTTRTRRSAPGRRRTSGPARRRATRVASPTSSSRRSSRPCCGCARTTCGPQSGDARSPRTTRSTTRRPRSTASSWAPRTRRR